MTYLTDLYLPGALALWCALAFALASLWGYSLVLRGDRAALLFARRAYRFFTLSIVLTAFILAVLLLRRDFRIEYVYQYSGLDLARHYQLAAFWAGQKGSFLIWLLWGSLLGLGVAKSAGKDEPSVMGVYTLVLLGLLFILVRESPFVMLHKTPTDGAGLNPLLQNNWMVIHPPIMFIGYAASAIPFAFAMAALWRRDTSRWAARAFPWALAGFLVLGTAILLGGYWAYVTLGWGGYWGWDPVENASLIPWLFGTALIHGLHMERTRGRFRRANLIFAALTFMSVLYGTFLTRSGVLADFSVHSFVGLGISGWLIGLMAFFGLMAVYLLATRLKSVPTKPNEDPFLSRGSFMVMGSITIILCAILVSIGTSAPLLTGFLKNPGQVGPDFYNRVNLPIAILVALLMAVVPYLTWSGRGGQKLSKKLRWPAAVGVLAAIVAVVFGVRNPVNLSLILFAGMAAASNLQKTIEKGRHGGLKAAGGYLAHVGVAVLLLGVISSAGYGISKRVTLTRGIPQQVGSLRLTFMEYLPRTATQRERMKVAVQKPDGSIFFSYPQLFVNDRTGQLMAHPDVHSELLQDLYVSPIEYDPGQPPGGDQTVQLSKGQSAQVGNYKVTFDGFDLNAQGNALTAMENGGLVTIGAQIELTGKDGKTERFEPLYHFQGTGRVSAPDLALPAGGTVGIRGINASKGAVQLELTGLAGSSANPGTPATLSLDVSHKPLIGMVWGGLYIILIGGILAIIHRAKMARKADDLSVDEHPAQSA